MKEFTYVETQEENRKEYKGIMKDISAAKIVYVDESGVEERKGRKGQKIAGKRGGKYYGRRNIITIIALLVCL